MVLNIHSDASYLNAREAWSHIGGHYFLGWIPHDNIPIKLNGAIHVISTILKFVAASTTEAKLGALFVNAKEGHAICLILQELGHPQLQSRSTVTTPPLLELPITQLNANDPV